MRKYVDCRDYPSETNCSLRISGTEHEVLDAAYEHAIKVHGHAASESLREAIRDSMRDEAEGVSPPFPEREPEQPGAF